MPRRCLLICLCALALFAEPVTGWAETAAKSAPPKSLGTFGAWKAYSYSEKGQTVCYMTLTEHFKADKKIKRTLAYLTITHRPAENSKDVVSYTPGYNFKTTSDVDVVAGKRSFNLFTQNGTAWSRDPATDRALAAAIRDASSIRVTGSPAVKDAKPITDIISTKGAAAAYKAIGKACGYAVEPPAKPVKAKTVAKKPSKKTKGK